MRSATATTSVGPVTSWQRTTNSSPPSRATRSPGRISSPSRRGDLDEQRVADAVPTGVVDHLEAVEVDEQDGEARPSHDQGRVDALEELGAVGQAGERVVPGLVCEALFEQPTVGDVLDLDDHLVVNSGDARQLRAGDEAPPHAVGAGVEPHVQSMPVRGLRAAQGFGDRRPVVGYGEVDE